ncbi:hypothetical protein ACQPZA_08185 [Pseudonocardia xinjiangensis]|uniref:hypothetical protein n=1 Tax=Pseudonocardia xinjiangensis TaxID=75289 RepID=UPI003D8E0827
MGLTGGIEKSGKPDLLAAAASLRWVRPDLTSALADHVLEWALSAGEQDIWLAAAGWALHGRQAIGDGRDTASDIVEALPRWGAAPLADPVAHRLRVELALVAGRVGERGTARAIVAPVTGDGVAPELRAEAFCVLARCAVDDAPDQVVDALRDADAAWSKVDAPCREIGAASVALVRAAAERQAGRPGAAVDHAAEGLTRLERGRESGTSGTPSAHLAAALAAEWISALLDAGRVAEAREGCVPLMPRLTAPSRASRHLARLRLTVARTVATVEAAATTVETLEQAASDASASDVPDLEAVCHAALGAVHEKAGRSDRMRESMRAADAAERRDDNRSRRLRAALATLELEAPAGLPALRERRPAAGPTAPPETRDVSTAPPGDEPAGEWAVPWDELSGESPIGDLLVRSLRPGGRSHERSGDDLGDGSVDEDRLGVAGGLSGSEPAGAASSRLDDSWLGDDWLKGGARDPLRDDFFKGGRLDDDLMSSLRDDVLGGRRRRSSEQPDAGRPSAAGWLPGLNADAVGARRTGRSRASDRRTDDGGLSAADWLAGGVGGEVVSIGGRGRRDDKHQDDTAAGATTANRFDEDAAGGGLRTDDAGSDRRRLSAADWLAGGVGSGRDGAPRRPVGKDGADRDDERSRRQGRAQAPRRASRREGGRSGAHRPLRALEDLSGDGEGGGRRGEDRAAPAGRRDEPGRGHTDPPPNGRRKHRLDDPWATGQWSVVPRADRPTERVRDAAALPVREPAVSTAEAWLNAALIDLDRVRKRSKPTGSAPVAEAAGTDVEGTAVAIDLVREGQRFTGGSAGPVVRALAERLTDRLPPGARLRFDDADALSVVMPGRERAEAAEWMHRTLPGLLEGFEVDGDLPGTHLRAAVHGAEGPVGAQILQRLDSGDSRRGKAMTTTGKRDEEARADNGRVPRERWGDLGAAIRSAGKPDAAPSGSRRRRAREGGIDPDQGSEWDAMRNAGPFGSASSDSDPDVLWGGADPLTPSRRAGSRWDRWRAAAAAQPDGAGGTAAHGRDADRDTDTDEDRVRGAGGGKAEGRAATGDTTGYSLGNGSAGNGSAASGSAGNGSARHGSAGNGSVGNGSAGNGSAGNGSARHGSVGNGSAGNGPAGGGSAVHRSTGNGSARHGSAGSGSAESGSARHGSAGNGNGSARHGSAGNGSAGNESAGEGSARNGSAASGSAWQGSAGNGSAGRDSAGSGSVSNGSAGNGSAGSGSAGNGSAEHGSASNTSATNGRGDGGSTRSTGTAGNGTVRDGDTTAGVMKSSPSANGTPAKGTATNGTATNGTGSTATVPSAREGSVQAGAAGEDPEGGRSAIEGTAGGASRGAGDDDAAGGRSVTARSAGSAGEGSPGDSSGTGSGSTAENGTGTGGRHDAAGRAPFQVAGDEDGSGNGGRRNRHSTESAAKPESTEGLGIADLLAGALAAYRGI